MARRLVLTALALFAVLMFGASPAQAERLKDLVQVEGARTNQLIGYGLVVGLSGTGDQTTQIPYSVQAIQNMLRQLGLTLNSSTSSFLQPTSVAAVMVTAELPTFVQVGQRIDVTVSSMGNATSLLGGVLLMTELRGADGQVYAIAQGSLLVSGFKASGQAASTSVNIPTVGHIPDGASVERSIRASIWSSGAVLLDLNEQSFGTAARITEAINGRMAHIASAVSAGQIRVIAPEDPDRRVRFLSELLDIEVNPDAPRAEVVIDAQSGTVVMGADVEIGPAAVAYGGLSVTIDEKPEVSQPSPFSKGGRTVEVPRTTVKAEQKQLKVIELKAAPRISDIVRNLNAIGARSSDLIAILQALRGAGALHAHIKVI